MLAAEGVKAVQVPLDPVCFDLDLAAIEAAITPRTRIVVVNSPHNPTGRIYPRAQLEALADLLERASARSGRRSEEHTSELQSLMRISYAVFCLKKKNTL